ncbi:hypothetical protein M9Y10_034418 [Tritrichomonas musculus]|uniref:Protein kinase domain-containing protein n=1 Tax=Tritrichomonas musculus TaxID=1915356 RepID=A0ABR2KEV4_9EUKA
MLEKYLLRSSDYIKDCEIGHGCFGVAYLAHPKDNESKKIVLKSIDADDVDFATQQNFIREVSVMAVVNHANLLKLIGFSLPEKDNKEFCIYSKFVPNKTLDEVMKRDQSLSKKNKILTPTRLSIICYEIASAMKYLHQQKIVHRDLKPANILLDKDYHAVLADFGLSKFNKDGLIKSYKLGTPYFMAPELFEENKERTNKIDVYAFGVTILSLFSTNFRFFGKKPKNYDEYGDYIIGGNRFKIPAKVPEFYRSLITRCWADDPNERPSFEEIVKEMEQDDSFIFNGSDINAVHDFIINYKNTNDFSANVKTDDEEEECFEVTTEFNFNA